MKKKPSKNRIIFIVAATGITIASIVAALAFSTTLQSPPTDQIPDGDDLTGDDNRNNDDSQPTEEDMVNVNSNSTRFVIGNPTDIGEAVGMQSLLLDSPGEKVSFRFTAKYSGEVKTLVAKLLTGYVSPLKGGLQEDYGSGLPSGEWLGEPGLGSGKIDNNGFTEIDLPQPVQIMKDKVYHFVIESVDEEPNSVGSRVSVYHLNNLVQPLNDENPDVPWPDPEINTLFDDGKGWKTMNNWPIFVVKYSDGRSQGQPYSLSAPWVIFGSRYVGQQLTPSSDYILEKFGISVSIDGIPADDLYYEIRDGNNSVLRKGFFAEGAELDLQRDFVEVKLQSPMILKKDVTYRFVLLSPETLLKEPYRLYGHEYSYDQSIGYGGLRQLLTISYDSGATWNRWEDADTIFTLTVYDVK